MGYDYAVTFLRTWRGNVNYRGALNPVERGVAFCNYPGEALVATPEAGSVGSFNVLMLGDDLIREWAEERKVRAPQPRFKAHFPRMSEELWTKFQRVSSLMTPHGSALQLQAEVTEFAGVLVGDLIAGAADQMPPDGPALRGTARMRECLHEEGFDIDLETLASRAGLSKFQALRAFKRRYGLPPHAYQICLRIALARRLLLDGAALADIAARCGFVDQSHLNRHFKRIVGVTPLQYLQAEPGSRSRDALIIQAADSANSLAVRGSAPRAIR